MAERPATNERIEYLEGRVDDAYAKIQASGLQNPSFVFQPGGPATAPPNVFNTQAKLNAAMLVTQGQRAVGVDATYSGGTATLNPASWSALDDIDVIGLNGPESPTINVNGPIAGVRSFQNCQLHFVGTFRVTPAGAFSIFKLEQCFIASATATVFDVTAAGALQYIFIGEGGSFGFVANNVPLATWGAASGGVVLEIGPLSGIGSNILFGPQNKLFGTVQPTGSQDNTQPGITGVASPWPVSGRVSVALPQQLTVAVRAANAQIPPTTGVTQTVFSGATDMAYMCGLLNTWIGPKTVAFDFNAATTFPAGTYDFEGASGNNAYDSTWLASSLPAPITLQDGSVIHGVSRWIGVQLTAQHVAPNAAFNVGFTAENVLEDTTLTATSTGAVFNCLPGNNFPRVALRRGSQFVSGICFKATTGGGGSQLCALFLDSTSSIGANTLAGDVGTTISVYLDPGAKITMPQASIAGTLVIVGTDNCNDFVQRTVGAAAGPDDIFGVSGSGVTFVPDGPTVKLTFSASGSCDAANRTVTPTFAVPAGWSPVAGSQSPPGIGAGDAAHTAPLSGVAIAKWGGPANPPGTAGLLWRVTWAIDAGTWAQNGRGHLAIENVR